MWNHSTDKFGFIVQYVFHKMQFIMRIIINRHMYSIYVFYPISTLPEHLHSTILRTPKLPENTHNPKETSFHPPSTLVPLLANYPHSHYSPPHFGGPTNTHPFLVIPSFGVPGVGCLLGRSLLCAFALPIWFQSYRCLYCLFLSRHSVIAFMLSYYIQRSVIIRF